MLKIVPEVPDCAKGEVILVTPPKSTPIVVINPCKRWCFTLNGYLESDEAELIQRCCAMGAKYCIGREVGESGNPHLQGYIEFAKKIRPLSLKFSFYAHWEKCKGTRDDNLRYCTKDGAFKTNFFIDKPLKLVTPDMFYHWQAELYCILASPADERTIHWYWEKDGGVGKSAFCKFVCANMNAVMVDGKGLDIFQGIAGHKDLVGAYPDIVLVDCPRHNIDYMNYGAIEKCKNGHVFSGKYESKQMLFNSPHIVIFANSRPDQTKFSADRWNIVYIKK